LAKASPCRVLARKNVPTFSGSRNFHDALYRKVSPPV
jgi:hypothetical protein